MVLKIMANYQALRQAEHFKKIAHEYSYVRQNLLVTKIYYEYWTSSMLEYLDPNSELHVLDTMCGSGELLKDAPPNRWRIFCNDLSIDILQHAENPENRFTYLCADSSQLPFGDNSFDAVVIRGGLHHFPEYWRLLAEIYRILKPGGMFICSEPTDDFPLYRLLRNIIYTYMDTFDEETEQALKTSEFRKHLQSTGFNLKDLKRFGFAGYLVIGQTDVLKFFQALRYIPGNKYLARGLITLDRLCARLPGVNWLSLAFTACAVKPGRKRDEDIEDGTGGSKTHKRDR
jgi:ubiquinone/menaquinone biosynthesis C-methylase UbiE